jgi:hypothetical protein
LGQPSSHDDHVSVCSTRDQLVQPLEKRERAKKLGLVWERDEIEADKDVDANFVACTLGLELSGEKLFDFAIRIAAPGFVDTSYWTVRSRGPTLQLYPPTHPFTKTR